MSSQDLFEKILNSLNAGVLDDARWPATSRLIDEFCGAKGNFLVLCDGAKHDDIDFVFARFCFGGQRHTELEREYFEDYHYIDERLSRITKLPDSKVTSTRSLFSDAEKSTSVIYNQLLPRIENRDGLTVRLDGPGGSHIVWGTFDPERGNDWSSAQVETINRLLPHLRQFMWVRQALVNEKALGSSLAGMLDIVGTGVILLDRRARVVVTNERARALLRRGDAVSDENGALRAFLPEEDAVLQRLQVQALPFLGGPGVGGSMLVSRADSSARLMLHVSPISEAEQERYGSRIGALVLVVDPGGRTSIDPERVEAVLGLTPAQSQVAVSLVQGKTIRDIASETGRSQTTIRWHLRNIFAKHGLSRQVELVELVTSLAGIMGLHH